MGFPIIALINCGSRYITEIELALHREKCRVEIVSLALANDYCFDSVHAAVISGGPHFFTESSDLIRKFEFIDCLKIPVLGICLGHQAMGIRSGVKAYRGVERRTSESVRIISHHELLKNLPETFIMKTDHCEGIPLPEGFRLLASSDYYPVEVMASTRRPHFGVQFHPEASGEPGRILLHNFCNLAR